MLCGPTRPPVPQGEERGERPAHGIHGINAGARFRLNDAKCLVLRTVGHLRGVSRE